MTGVKCYQHEYVEQLGPKVVFGDDSACTTKGYGSIKCNGILFINVAFINGLKYNLICIGQLCNAKCIVQFDEKRGTTFNSNKEIVMIALRYCLEKADLESIVLAASMRVLFFLSATSFGSGHDGF
nr:retrovirus-related Pol polyprotein from transposon TNT 1-94 [Tanacetum cinerariifolium]